MFRQVTCVTAACDDCGLDYNDDDSDWAGIFHFTDQDDALKHIDEWGGGWRIRAGGQLICRRCAAQQDCATWGHNWSAWKPCLCAGRIGDHTVDQLGVCTFEHRWCDRCMDGEDRQPEHTTPPAAASAGAVPEGSA